MGVFHKHIASAMSARLAGLFSCAFYQKPSGKQFMDIVPVDTKRERDALNGFGESTEEVMALLRLSCWTRVHLPAIAKEQALVVHKRHLFGSRMLTMIYTQLVVQDTVSAPCCSRCLTLRLSLITSSQN